MSKLPHIKIFVLMVKRGDAYRFWRRLALQTLGHL